MGRDENRSQRPGRCGTCRMFPGNAINCPDNTRKGMRKVYYNDYGKDHCGNYTEAVQG